MAKTNKMQIFLVIMTIFAVGLSIVNFYLLTQKDNNQGGTTTARGNRAELLTDDPVIGDNSAPVTILMYSDPSCPFCAAASGVNAEMVNYMKSRDASWEAPVPGILKDYVKTGKVQLVFRYYPGHGTGGEAFKMMYCANEQGKFWEMHDAVFEHQDQVEDVEALKGYAAGLGIDTNKLDACMAGSKASAKMQQDTNLGRQGGISGTPGFIVNGQVVSGAVSYPSIKQVIDSKLA